MRLAPSRAISSSVSVISPACTEEVSVDSLSMGGVSFPPPASGVFVGWAHAEGYAALFHPLTSRHPPLLRIPPIEALDEAILDWLARLNVVNPDVPGVGPGTEGPAGELRSIVGHDDLRQAALLPEPLEHFDDPHCGNRVRHMDRQALS